ncbi:hypothetical protein [Limosilactobacillus coleohominis]|uniref:DNA-directed DNA polymerase n=1 Tax=Limosilactobacillus coleohominis TaxID=181675 RepID=A0ABS2GUW5_9LACO|nr:hypothetical protein [Limosilactobacillus coleohominis]MBM6940050.1 hypothetical protein [Limosilactobacillus coleohominis]
MPRKKIKRELVLQNAPNEYSSQPYMATTAREKQHNLFAKAYVWENSFLEQVKQKVVPFLNERLKPYIKESAKGDADSLKKLVDPVECVTFGTETELKHLIVMSEDYFENYCQIQENNSKLATLSKISRQQKRLRQQNFELLNSQNKIVSYYRELLMSMLYTSDGLKMLGEKPKKVIPTKMVSPLSNYQSASNRGFWVSHNSVLGILDPYYEKSHDDPKEFLSAQVDFLKKLFKGVSKPRRNYGDDENTIRKVRAVVSIDAEWDIHHKPHDNAKDLKLIDKVAEEESNTPRSFDDVINIAFCIWFPDKTGPDKNKIDIVGSIFNLTGEGFNFTRFFALITSLIEERYPVPQGKQLMLDRLDMLLTGYFLGVDISCLKGWNLKHMDITVLRKQYIFTNHYFCFKVKTPSEVNNRKSGCHITLTIRDAGLLAPKGNLESLGGIVGVQKLDTEAYDVKTGHPRGFYKSHMKQLLHDDKDTYLKYVFHDAEIPIKFLQAVASSYHINFNHFSQFPVTTGQYAMNQVAAELKKHPEQSVYDDKYSQSDIKKDPLACVKTGYRDCYEVARKSFFGGYNVAFGCLVIYGNVVDLDLTSAYNTAGILMPCLNYNAKKSHQITDIGRKFVELSECSYSFDVIYQHLKKLAGFPFVMGCGEFDIDYPDDYQGIITTPMRDGQKGKGTGSPIYVKHQSSNSLPLIDVINAYEHGARIKVHSLFIPAQTWKQLNVYGKTQFDFRKKRDLAKRKRDGYPKGSSEYLKYDGEQLFWKLAGNVIFGKSAQAVTTKQARNYQTNRMEKMPVSKITDPLIASTYTSITRYLANHLYDALQEFYGDNIIPLNITTDGEGAVLKPGIKFDFDGVNKLFNAKLPEHYRQVLKAIGTKAGFERKFADSSVDPKDWDDSTWVFNTKTRFNGALNGSINAMASIRSNTYSPKEVYDLLNQGVIAIHQRSQRFVNLTAMKYGTLNHRMGLLYVPTVPVWINLQYDCACKPDQWLFDDWQGFGFLTTFFEDNDEHNNWKKRSKILTDRFNIMRSNDRFDCYLKTMETYSFGNKKSLDDSDKYDDMVYVLNHISKSDKADRKYKDKIYRFKKAIKAGDKVAVPYMCKYRNQYLNPLDATNGDYR